MTEIDFRTTSLAELARSVRAKEVGARELTEAALDRIQRLNPTYNAFVAVDGERALHAAAGIDERVVAGEPGAVDSYLAFLKSAGSMYPLEGLRLAGVDMNSPEPVEAAFATLALMVSRLEELTAG